MTNIASYIFSTFANYGCNTYGSGTYDNALCSTTSNPDGIIDRLANTGFDILIPIFLGIALIIAGAILLVRLAWRKHKQKKGGNIKRPLPPADKD